VIWEISPVMSERGAQHDIDHSAGIIVLGGTEYDGDGTADEDEEKGAPVASGDAHVGGHADVVDCWTAGVENKHCCCDTIAEKHCDSRLIPVLLALLATPVVVPAVTGWSYQALVDHARSRVPSNRVECYSPEEVEVVVVFPCSMNGTEKFDQLEERPIMGTCAHGLGSKSSFPHFFFVSVSSFKVLSFVLANLSTRLKKSMLRATEMPKLQCLHRKKGIERRLLDIDVISTRSRITVEIKVITDRDNEHQTWSAISSSYRG
jgi:hypothetical protein